MTGPHRFHHLGITVSDLNASYAFYRDVLGMRFWDQEKALGTAPTEGRHDAKDAEADVTFHSLRSEAFDELTANPGSEFKYVNLTSPDGFVLQLIEYTAAGGGTLELDHNRVGSPHMSFFVDDVAEAFEQCSAMPGVEVVSRLIDIGPNMRSFYVRDPDGVPVELLQVHD
jgi:catechol 2,3-dioxygenase-like lactoylglutathione lyase family enzyme